MWKNGAARFRDGPAVASGLDEQYAGPAAGALVGQAQSARFRAMGAEFPPHHMMQWAVAVGAAVIPDGTLNVPRCR